MFKQDNSIFGETPPIDLSQFYTKSQVDALLAPKANLTDSSGGKLVNSEVPDLAICNVFAGPDTAARDALVTAGTAETGDVFILNGSVDTGKTFMYSGSAWIVIENVGFPIIDDLSVSSTSVYSSQMVDDTYLKQVDLVSSHTTDVSKGYTAPYLNSVIDDKLRKNVTDASTDSAATSIFSIANTDELVLKKLKGSAVISESNGVIQIDQRASQVQATGSSNSTHAWTSSASDGRYLKVVDLINSGNNSASTTTTYTAAQIVSLLNGKLHDITSAGGQGLHLHNGKVNGVIQMKTITGASVTESNNVITIAANQIADGTVAPTSTYSSSKLEGDFVQFSNLVGSSSTDVSNTYQAPFIDSLLSGKIDTTISTPNDNTAAPIHSITGSTLTLKKIKGTAVSETGDVFTINKYTDAEARTAVILDGALGSTTSYSSQKVNNDFVAKTDIHSTFRTSTSELYSASYINSQLTNRLSTSVSNLSAGTGQPIWDLNGQNLRFYKLVEGTNITIQDSTPSGLLTISSTAGTILPNTTIADQFVTSTTTNQTYTLSTKLSLNPCRFGFNTPTSMHADSTFMGVNAGLSTSNANIITAVGAKAAEGNGVGGACTAVGYRALDGSTGVRNTAVGHLAGVGLAGNDCFALGEGSMDGGSCSNVVGIGRYAFRGATASNCIGFGQNVMGSGFGFHTFATNSIQRMGNKKFLVGDNTSTAAWGTNSPYTGNPYLLDGIMGLHDGERELKINANDIYLGAALPTSNQTIPKKLWSDNGVLRYGYGNALLLPPVPSADNGRVLTVNNQDDYVLLNKDTYSLASNAAAATVTLRKTSASISAPYASTTVDINTAGMLPSFTNNSGKLLAVDAGNSGVEWVDPPSSLPSQSSHSGGLLTTDGTNASWSTDNLSVQSTGATIGNTSAGAKSLSFKSNVTSGIVGRIDAYDGSYRASSIIQDATPNHFNVIELQTQQGGTTPLTVMKAGAQSTTDETVTVFGSLRTIHDIRVGKTNTSGVREVKLSTSNNAGTIGKHRYFAKKADGTELEYGKDEHIIGNNHNVDPYGYSTHTRIQDGDVIEVMRVGKNLSSTAEYVNVHSSMKITNGSEHRLMLGDFTNTARPAVIDHDYNLSTNASVIGEHNYRALDSNGAQTLYAQAYAFLASNNPTYGAYVIKTAQGGAIGSSYVARFGKTSASSTEDIDLQGVTGVDTIRFGDGTTLTSAPYDRHPTAVALSNGSLVLTMYPHTNVVGNILPTNSAGLLRNNGTGTLTYEDIQVKSTLQSGATQSGLEVYNCFYHDTVRGVDVALINTKLDSANVKNTLQSGATQSGTEVYNCFYHDTVRGVDVALINTKLNSTYVKNVLQTTALFAGLEVYNCWYLDTVRQLDAQVVATKLNSSNVKNTLQSGATINGTEVYNCFYHDTVRNIDQLAKLDKSHVKSTYLTTPATHDVYDCSFVNEFYRPINNEKHITLVSSNTSQNDTLGSIQAWNGNTHISSAIAFCHSDEATVSGRLNFYSYTNNNHATRQATAYMQDDITGVKDLEALKSITLKSPATVSEIVNQCPANPKFITKSTTTSSGSAVIGNFQTQALVSVTGNVQYPPALSSNTSTVSGVTYTITSSTNAFVGSSYDRYKAFDRINNTGWHTESRYSSQSNYTGSASLGGVDGEYIILEMSSALPFGTVKIIGRNGYDQQAPDEWEILASNNGTSWTSILQSTVHATHNGGNGHTVTINNTTSYTHYALVVKSIGGNGSGGYCSLHEIEFYTATTTAYGEFTDFKTTRYGTDWAVLDINVRQNAATVPLMRIGKSQTSDPHQIIINGSTSVTSTMTLADLRIVGTGSGITFDSGQQQSEAVTAPAANLDGYRLTANATGGWSWESPDVFYTPTDRNINIGPINSTLGVDSISIGYYAGQIDSSRSREASIFIGTRAGQNTIPTSTDQSQQFDNAVMVGHQAGMNSIYMENCCAVGSNAGGSVECNPHSNSNFFGSYAGHDSGYGASANSYSNGFFGTNAGRNYVGIESQGFGRDALYTYQKVTSQRSGNNAMGATSCRNMVGSNNCAQGSASMRWDSGGTVVLNDNVALGADCMGRLTVAGVVNSNDNVFIGSQSARQLSGNAVGNVGIGRSAFYQGVGSKNVMIGFQCGSQHNGSNCIYIGENVGFQQAESNKLRIGTFQNQQLIVGTMGSTSAASELQLNAANVELARSDLPTAYDSANPNRIWVDGTGTGSNKSGVLRIGDVPFFCQVSGRDTSSFSNSFTTYIFPTVERDVTSAYNTSTGTITLPSDGVYQITGTMRSSDGMTVGRQFGVGVHHVNQDGAHFLWHAVQNTTNGHDRTTYPYVRTGYFTQGTQLRMFVYVDGGAITMKMGGLSVYRLSD